jgi:hypothetical protein
MLKNDIPIVRQFYAQTQQMNVEIRNGLRIGNDALLNCLCQIVLTLSTCGLLG